MYLMNWNELDTFQLAKEMENRIRYAQMANSEETHLVACCAALSCPCRGLRVPMLLS